MYPNRQIRCPECGSILGYETPTNKIFECEKCKRSQLRILDDKITKDSKGRGCKVYHATGTIFLTGLKKEKVEPGIRIGTIDFNSQSVKLKEDN